MLRPLKRARKNCYSTLDIETRKDGSVIEIGVYNGTEVFFYKSWEDFFKFIKFHNDDKRYNKFIAHNGGGFDYISMLDYLSTTNIEYEVIMSGSTIIFISITTFDRQVIFQDSARVLLRPLKELCVTYQVETPKQDIDMEHIEDLYINDLNTFHNYLASDVISLYQVCKAFEKIMEIEFFPVTIASLSLYLFRKNFQTENYFQLFKEKQDKFISQAYAGGRVECFRTGEIDNINTYDINSLYPYIMKNCDMPIGLPIYTKKYRPEYKGFYKVKFHQKNTKIPPILWEKNKNGLEFVYSGVGIFYDAEIKLAKERKVELEFIEGYVFLRHKKIFAGFVDKYYELRQKHKGTAIDFSCKIVLNSLYGKFGQREKSEKLVHWSPETMRYKVLGRKVKNWKPYDEDKGYYIVEEFRKTPNRIIHYAAAVTSHARVELYRYLYSYRKNLVYCDTDCIHLYNKHIPGNRISNTRLGYMKKEEEGTGIYIGRKQYTINGKMKYKGIKIVDKLLKNKFNIDNYRKILYNEKILYSYGTFPKLKSVIKGRDRPCKIKKVEKSLTQSKYKTNYKPKGVKL